ncbi:MAG: hypothetical protein AAF658_20390 [Myxococcota bacterium]
MVYAPETDHIPRGSRGGLPLPDDYTERPPLAEASRAQLLYTLQLRRALNDDPEFLKELERSLESDITDTRTEFGGYIVFAPDGSAQLLQTYSYSESDGAFFGGDAEDIPPGLSFHFHALTDNNAADGYAGPSGSLGGGGDIGYAEARRAVNVVFTTAGRTENERLSFNTDTFAVNRLPNGDRTAVVIALGSDAFEH